MNMTDATNLPTVSSLGAADLFMVVSATNDDVRLAPRSVVEAAIGASPADLTSQYATPTTGSTVTVAVANSWLILTHGATIATLTIALPAASDQQELQITSNSIVTTLTFSGAATSGAPATIAAGGFARLKYDGVLGLWRRVG